MALAAVPRLLRLEEITKQWIRHPTCWSPRELLTGDASHFPASSLLTVKRSLTSRFFMYEEHARATKLDDKNGPTQVLQRAPWQLAELLHEGERSTDNEGVVSKTHPIQAPRHHYWTAPIAEVAPVLLQQLQGYESLHENKLLFDPRGPSLWMGSSGSATQAHYDVADNVIVQLFGTKRIRCYHPSFAPALHVFPDAHPRARKSQVNFDAPDHERFFQYSSLPSPVLDVVLQPGDALRIPAFWFHHVENGKWMDSPLLQVDQRQGPSVSLNMFALSASMLVAQEIFRDASRPFGFMAAAPGGRESSDAATAERHFDFAVVALRALGWGLLEGLGIEGTPSDFLRTSLLDTRYVPLHQSDDFERKSRSSRLQKRRGKPLTESEEQQVAQCIARILPQFALLRGDDDDDGVLSLVACHLLELWAVELVGASSVANVWEAVLIE